MAEGSHDLHNGSGQFISYGTVYMCVLYITFGISEKCDFCYTI